ncbi:MAG: acetyl-CoA carboxylase carboxyl transferase subunit alpha, partial [Bryobacteraceae bacterium]
LKLTAENLVELGLIDGIIPEPPEGAHTDPDGAAANVRETLRDSLDRLNDFAPEDLVEQRYLKFRQMGNFFL